jgi:ribosomal protein S18 acetylase RimI-like enzyme
LYVGIAKYLISKCIDVARDAYQCPFVYLQVESDNVAALQLYDRLGFEVCDVKKERIYVDKEFYIGIEKCDKLLLRKNI